MGKLCWWWHVWKFSKSFLNNSRQKRYNRIKYVQNGAKIPSNSLHHCQNDFATQILWLFTCERLNRFRKEKLHNQPCLAYKTNCSLQHNQSHYDNKWAKLVSYSICLVVCKVNLITSPRHASSVLGFLL